MRRLTTLPARVVLAAILCSACVPRHGGGNGDSGSSPTDPEYETRVTHQERPDRYETCPSSGITPPPQMVLVDRSLPNLGTGFLGRVETYDAGATRLEVSVGVDVLDGYDDLDFQRESVSVAGLKATLLTAGAFGTDDRLVILTWDAPAKDASCALHALVGTNLPAETLVEIASGTVTAMAGT